MSTNIPRNNKESLDQLLESIIPLLRTASEAEGSKIGEIKIETKVVMNPLPNVHPDTGYFRIFITHEGAENHYGFYILKYFFPSEEGGNGFVRTDLGKEPAVSEYLLLRSYRDKGAHVPSPYLHTSEPGMILMEDMGIDSLEKKVTGKSEDKRVDLTSLALKELSEFHKAGSEIQGEVLRRMGRVVLSSGDLMKKLKSYYALLKASDEEVAEGKVNPNPAGWRAFCEASEPLVKSIIGTDQLIHGDMASYHVFFKEDEKGEEGVWFIDLGNPKFDHVAFDCAPLIFSKDINIPPERAEEVYISYLKNARLDGVSGSKLSIEKKIVSKELNILLSAGVFQALRRAAKDKIFRLRYPSIQEAFISAHPNYKNVGNYYHRIAPETVRFLIENSDRFELKDDTCRLYEELITQLENLRNENNNTRKFNISDVSTTRIQTLV